MCANGRGEHRCAHAPVRWTNGVPVYATQAAGAQAQGPLGRACRRAQGGLREGTQGARLPPGPGWGMSSGSSEHPRECIMHSNKNAVIERKAMPREFPSQGPPDKRLIQEKEVSQVTPHTTSPSSPTLPRPPPKMTEREAKTQGQESPAQGLEPGAGGCEEGLQGPAHQPGPGVRRGRKGR